MAVGGNPQNIGAQRGETIPGRDGNEESERNSNKP